MATATAPKPTRFFGPWANGILMTPREFDRAQFERGYRYELINGVLVVSVSSLESQRDPNDELGRHLRNFQADHPQGFLLDATLPEHTIHTGENRRVVDRALWIGLGRVPRRKDVPAVTVEFVSAGKRNVERDYETKRGEYQAVGVREYWIFDRFAGAVTVFYLGGRRLRKRVFTKQATLTTDLLPGFKLPLAPLFALAVRWADAEEG